MVKKTDFYTLDRIQEYKATYNIIFGERSNGKTYAVLKAGLQEYIYNQGEFAVVRRWKEDIKGSRARDVFSALVSNDEVRNLTAGEYTGIHYYAGKWFLCNYDEAGKAIYADDKPFAHAFALSDNEHNKSISFPNIKTILFDEFITNGLYLQDEFVIFMNTISTIVRKRKDVIIYMLGNTVNRYSPYFREMGLTHITEMEQGSIDIYRYGDGKLTVAVEYTHSIGKTKDGNSFYFAFDNPKLNMITEGAWELDIYPHLPIKYKPKDVEFTYFIIFDDNIYQCEIVNVENTYFTFIHIKTTDLQKPDDDLIYTLDYDYRENYHRGLHKNKHKIGRVILDFFLKDKVFYQDNSVGDSIKNFINISSKL